MFVLYFHNILKKFNLSNVVLKIDANLLNKIGTGVNAQ